MSPRSREARSLPAGLLLARSPRMEQEPLRLGPRASHPAVTHRARRGGDRPSRTGPSTTPTASTEPPNGASYFHSCTLMSHIVAGGFHYHARNLLCGKMIPHRHDLSGSRSERGDRFAGFSTARTIDPDADFGVPFRNVQARAPRMNDVHRRCSLPSLVAHYRRCPSRGGQESRKSDARAQGTNPRFPWKPSTTMLTYGLNAPRSLRGQPRRTR